MVSVVVWLWANVEGAEKILQSDFSSPVKIVALGLMAVFWALFLLGLNLVVSGCVTFFARKEGLVCEHTLVLREDGLEEETAVNRSLHRRPAVDGMRRTWGHWFVRLSGGSAFVFRPCNVLEGDPAQFAACIHAWRKRG